MAKGQKQKKRAVPSPLAPATKMKKFQKKKAKDAAARTPHASDANEVGDAAAGRRENGATGRLAGFMFVCDALMAHLCFEYRMFALPRQRLELVKKIRKGTMLFLYDFDRDRLYGGYKAISNGGLNLEAATFNGTRPAQVKFQIVKGFKPLHKDWFQHVILENFVTGNFNPELNSEQVKKLMSLFPLPISALQCLGERHRLPPDDRYRSALYQSVITAPQDAYRQPVAAPFNRLDSQASSDMDRVKGLLKRVEGIMDRVEEVFNLYGSRIIGIQSRIMGLLEQVGGIKEGLLQTLQVIQRELPPAPPPPSYGGIQSRIMGLLEQVGGIKEGLLVIRRELPPAPPSILQTLQVIRRELFPAPPSRDYGSLKATEGERASGAGHPPSAE